MISPNAEGGRRQLQSLKFGVTRELDVGRRGERSQTRTTTRMRKSSGLEGYGV